MLASRQFALIVAACVVIPAIATGLPGCGGRSGPVKPVELSASDIVKRYKPAIVRIENKMGERVGVGTGFILTPEGRIVTNLHVIGGGGSLTVKLSNGTIFPVQRVVAIDEQRDLAIIEIDTEVPLPTLPLGNSDLVSPGDAVIAIGNPQLLDFTVSDGLISAVRKYKGSTYLQISAPISQGSSGGPLFNSFGEVIGVAMGFFIGGQNLNFGVPTNYLAPLLAHDGSETMAQFAARYAQPEPTQIKSDTGTIMREIPRHDLAILNSCTEEQFVKVYTGINRAIELGAPLYNEGDHEACYGIYQQTAAHFERDNAMCKGLRDAFGAGLLKAETKADFTRKAWAMRDTFDGVLRVLIAKARSN